MMQHARGEMRADLVWVGGWVGARACVSELAWKTTEKQSGLFGGVLHDPASRAGSSQMVTRKNFAGQG